MIKKITDILEIGERGADLVKYVSAANAFHRYSWFRQLPLPNVAGNFRGIVASRRLKSVWEISGKTGEYLGGACLLLMFARNMALVHHEVEAICRSRDPWGVKTSRLICQASAVMLKTAAYGAVGGVDMILSAAKDARYWSLLATGGDLTHPTMTQLFLDFNSARLGTFADRFGDGDQLYSFVRLRFPG